MAHAFMTLLFSQDIHTESSQFQTFNIHLSVSQVITIYLGSRYLPDLNILKMQIFQHLQFHVSLINYLILFCRQYKTVSYASYAMPIGKVLVG